MGTFIYTPGVRAYIKTDAYGTLDISDDLTTGQLVRRSDGVSTFDFNLQNIRRKYDGVFTPNDVIVVLMKRVTWLRVFTGYLNSVPLRTAWPREVSLSSSCSLKRLQYWFWDPYSQAAINLMTSQFSKGSNEGGMVNNMIMTLLEQVVGWPRSNVHIGKIPDDWYNIAYKIGQRVAAWSEESEQLANAYADEIGIGPIISGAPFAAYRMIGLGGDTTDSGSFDAGTPNTTGGANLPQGDTTYWTANPGALDEPPIKATAANTLDPGTYGGEALNDRQVKVIEQIYDIGAATGHKNRAIISAIMAGMQESRLNESVVPFDGSSSTGLFQMTKDKGTFEQRNNVAFACRWWFKTYDAVPGVSKMSLTAAAQAVERSAYPDAYGKHEAMARAVVARMISKIMNRTGVQQGTDPTSTASTATKRMAPTSIPNSTAPRGAGTGDALVATALKLVRDHPRIPYVWGGADLSAVPRGLDCSGFVLWVLNHTLGSSGGMPRVSHDQARTCKRITTQEALNTPGALLFSSNNGQASGVYHVEMSLGNGNSAVGAHRTGTFVSVQKNTDWSFGGLIPAVSYPGGPTGAGPTVADATGFSADGGSVPGTWQDASHLARDLPNYDPNDQIDALFGDLAWRPVVPQGESTPVIMANALSGALTLMNDTPLLPYLKNLFASTMHSFCSAPNGDIIGWFPDYYGIWGTAAVLRVEKIEVQDFNVTWSDDQFVTHQFVQAGKYAGIDVATGLNETSFVSDFTRTETRGIANIDSPEMMYSLFGIPPQNATNFAKYIYKKFGARPDFQQVSGVTSPKGEFFMAIYYFMIQWAYQYQASIPMTFMPEAWPGMLVQIPEFDFQAYITSVTHSFSFGPEGRFETNVNIAAPAYMPRDGKKKSNHALIGLPVAGGYINEPIGPTQVPAAISSAPVPVNKPTTMELLR